MLEKIGYFDKLERYRRPTQVLWLVSLLLIAPLLWLQSYFNASNSWGSWQSLAGLDIAAFMVTSLLLWAQTERWLMPLAAFGRMALTNYIMQTVVVFSLTLALGGFGSLTMKSVPFVWLAVWVVQVILSNLWLRYFNYGPLEWMWRWGTYGHRPIFVKNKPAEMS